uniref:Sod_Cu domain-containing protein n=1 Tax=Panagrellus redivivus TaxID=6233 RepID=A0A7E4VJW2_PANRE
MVAKTFSVIKVCDACGRYETGIGLDPRLLCFQMSRQHSLRRSRAGWLAGGLRGCLQSSQLCWCSLPRGLSGVVPSIHVHTTGSDGRIASARYARDKGPAGLTDCKNRTTTPLPVRLSGVGLQTHELLCCLACLWP